MENTLENLRLQLKGGLVRSRKDGKATPTAFKVTPHGRLVLATHDGARQLVRHNASVVTLRPGVSLVGVLAGAVATAQPNYSVAYDEIQGNRTTRRVARGAFNSVTAVTLLAAPSATVRYKVRSILVSNCDSASITLSLAVKNGSTPYYFLKGSAFESGDTLAIGPNGISTALTGTGGTAVGAEGEEGGTLPAGADKQILISNGSLWAARDVGGDLTLANDGEASIAKIQGAALSGTPANEKIIVATGATTAVWKSRLAGVTNGSDAAAGDVGEYWEDTGTAAFQDPSFETETWSDIIAGVDFEGGDWDFTGIIEVFFDTATSGNPDYHKVKFDILFDGDTPEEDYGKVGISQGGFKWDGSGNIRYFGDKATIPRRRLVFPSSKTYNINHYQVISGTPAIVQVWVNETLSAVVGTMVTVAGFPDESLNGTFEIAAVGNSGGYDYFTYELPAPHASVSWVAISGPTAISLAETKKVLFQFKTNILDLTLWWHFTARRVR